MDSDFRLGEWVVVPRLNSLSCSGKTVHLEPKVMQVLTCLAENGDVVSKETLMRTVWADTFVTDDVLTRSISELRKVFADDPRRPQYIQTIPKSGYRLLVQAVPVQPEKSSLTSMRSSSEAAVSSRAAVFVRRFSSKSIFLGGLALAAGVALALVAYFSGSKKVEGTSVAPGRNMLAVLPFQDLNKDSAHDFYADGLTAEMISQVGRLPSDRLGVIDWNSMIRYKGTRKTEDEIARELGVNYVLEGTVRRSGAQVRITAELVRIGDRSHVWANSYDGDLGDVLSLQTRVAKAIASEIQMRLTPEQEARLDNPGPLNPDAYTFYLQARFSVNRRTEADLRNMIRRFEQAIELDGNFAAPYVGMADAYTQLASQGFAPASAYARAREALTKALEIDPMLPQAHYGMGWVDWRGNWNFSAAEAEFRRAIELGDAKAHAGYSLYLKSMGRYPEALIQMNETLTVDPLDSYSQANAGHLLAMMGRLDESEQHFRRALDIGSNQAYVHERYGAVLLWQGKNEQAITEFEKASQLSDSQPEKLAWLAYAYAINKQTEDALKLLSQLQRIIKEGKQYVSPFHVALVYDGLGDRRNALRWLEEAYAQHDEWLVYLRVYPEFQDLHSEPRFISLEHQIGLIR